VLLAEQSVTADGLVQAVKRLCWHGSHFIFVAILSLSAAAVPDAATCRYGLSKSYGKGRGCWFCTCVDTLCDTGAQPVMLLAVMTAHASLDVACTPPSQTLGDVKELTSQALGIPRDHLLLFRHKREVTLAMDAT
jgi:hypothetical protein